MFSGVDPIAAHRAWLVDNISLGILQETFIDQ